MRESLGAKVAAEENGRFSKKSGARAGCAGGWIGTPPERSWRRTRAGDLPPTATTTTRHDPLFPVCLALAPCLPRGASPSRTSSSPSSKALPLASPPPSAPVAVRTNATHFARPFKPFPLSFLQPLAPPRPARLGNHSSHNKQTLCLAASAERVPQHQRGRGGSVRSYSFLAA